MGIFMTKTPALASWHFGPVQVWHLSHQPRTRGEIQARAWLTAELGFSTETLPLSRDHHGRPQLDAALAHWDTNWSHSGEHLLLALAKNVHLGVDLERQRPRRHLRQTIKQHSLGFGVPKKPYSRRTAKVFLLDYINYVLPRWLTVSCN